ncbi:MAG: hypothetical protein ACD_18C00064G0006 [uncultured bacterium]|nr:MAG: hypothetical protein ACD_18C00064G0006 [uncultured bacterium]OGH83602.1 MAG: hypothetical protein A2488_03520 [Candidatus Magasanikbacteria bacterium RIFOXYC12_FULL_32_21b]OGH90658.1 MAG: hypothetical protein A2507_01855 [Candidatus Magasanikbacteria bacterium RIFOXYD12_FULL_33_17]HAO52310.1 hypothetical protein [Candidatus Magasanikbacteria bacterium]
MKKILLHILISVTMFSFFAVPVFAQGVKNANSQLQPIAQKAGITESNLGNIAGTVISAILSLVGVIFLVLMVYAGILWMTARGKDDQTERAKNIIIAALIGLFIVVSAYAITKFVTSKLN